MTQDLHPVSQEMRDEIISRLSHIEQTHDVTILFACESGSRAWGFASPDSDYDVRFIYVRPADAYLTVFPVRDVIEEKISDDLDIVGWDLKKALGLMSGSNTTLMEWLTSPIQYIEGVPEFMGPLMEMAHDYKQMKKVFHHYMSLAHETRKRFVDGQTEVVYKKYFYILRPLLAASWVRKHGTVPPMEYERLAPDFGFPPEIQEAIDELFALKTGSSEKRKGPNLQLLEAFLSTLHEDLYAYRNHEDLNKDRIFRRDIGMGPLDEFFRKWVHMA